MLSARKTRSRRFRCTIVTTTTPTRKHVAMRLTTVIPRRLHRAGLERHDVDVQSLTQQRPDDHAGCDLDGLHLAAAFDAERSIAGRIVREVAHPLILSSAMRSAAASVVIPSAAARSMTRTMV